MINKEEYESFVNSIAEFVTVCMKLWSAQKELNVSLQQQVAEHLTILKVYRELLSDLRDQNIAFKSLLTEHESRLLTIERSLAGETIHTGFAMPKKN